MPAALAPPASLLFFASLRNAASLKAVLDLVDKDYSQDAGAAVCLLPLSKAYFVLDWQGSEIQTHPMHQLMKHCTMCSVSQHQ